MHLHGVRTSNGLQRSVEGLRKEAVEEGDRGKLDRKEVARAAAMKSAVNKALDFARFDDEIEVKSVGALRKLLARKPKEKKLELLQMQIKIRKYVYKVFRPVYQGRGSQGRRLTL